MLLRAIGLVAAAVMLLIGGIARADTAYLLDFSPLDLSGDGRVVLGTGGRWSVGSGFSPFLEPMPESRRIFIGGEFYDEVGIDVVAPYLLSFDGSTAVGSYDGVWLGNGFFTEPLVWRQGNGFEKPAEAAYPTPTGVGSSNGGVPLDLSGDGRIIVGQGREFPSVAFSWQIDPASSLSTYQNDLLVNRYVATSFDGSVSTGYGHPWDERGAWISYRDSLGPGSGEVEGLEIILDSSPLRSDFRPTDISADGTIIVGSLDDPTGSRAAKVSRSNDVARLPLLPGFEASGAIATTGDGHQVIGWLRDEESGTVQSVLWHGDADVHLLSVLLANAGLDTSDWSTFEARDISDDGRTLMGTYTDGTGSALGWILVVPEPSCALLLGLGLAVLGSIRRDVTTGSSAD